MTVRPVLVTLWLAIAGLPQVAAPPIGSLRPAAHYITSAFDAYPLVAFSEPGHGVAGTQEFFAALIRQPGFAGKVTDIVIECGNARYQNVADRYFAGEPVERDELRRIWEDTTVVSGVWQQPLYEAILADIRAFNLTLPPAARFRVLLGDPPIDWRIVRGPADEDMNDWRDAHFAWVIEQHVIKKGRRALVWVGGAHTGRKVIFPNSLIHLLDRQFPNQTLVVHAVDRADVSASVSARMAGWPVLSAAPVRDTWLGRLDVREVGRRLSRGILEDDVDAVVIWDSTLPATATARGNPGASLGDEFQRRQQLAEATLPFRGGRIRFEAGRASITAASNVALEAVLGELQRDTGLRLVVKAFTDAREPNGAQLSMERAIRVKNWLSGRGIDPARLEAKACGSARALWFGETEEERAANRRAELVRSSTVADCQPPSSFEVFGLASAQSRVPDPIPRDPVETIIRAFDQKPIVALAEAHALQEEHDLIVRLIRDPRFVDAASTIVVEWANVLYQDSIDRYVAGEDEPKQRVARAWRNTGFSPLAPWDAPVYERFFDVVREVNLTRPADRRLRVVAADPPVEWNATRQDIEATKQRFPRDTHFFQVIDREVLGRSQKALLIFGGGHLYRHWWNPFATGPTSLNLIDLLEQKARGSVFVIMVHAFIDRDGELESRLKAWKTPAMAQLNGTWLGFRSTDPLMQTSAERGFPDGTVARAKVNAYLGLKLQELADAYLYLGDMDSLTASVPTPTFFAANPDYVEELRRRFRLISGGELPDSYFTRERSHKYYQGGTAAR